MSLLSKFISADFGLEGIGRWWHSIEHDSLVYDAENDLFYWNSKDIRGNVRDYLIKVRGLPERSVDMMLRFGVDYSLEKKQLDSNEVSSSELPILFWKNGINKRDYWYKRLLTDETIDRFLLGYFDGWFSIPIFDKSDLINIQLRKDSPKKIKKWYRHREIGLLNKWKIKNSDTIFIVEGLVDAILLDQEGLVAVSKDSGANYWNSDWNNLFVGKSIYIIYDNDKAGFQGAKRVARNLGEYNCKIYNFFGFSDKYDIVDFFRDGGDAKQLLEIVESDSVYSFEL